MYLVWAAGSSASAFPGDPCPLCRSGQEAPSSVERIQGDKLDRYEFWLGLHDV